MNGEGVRDISTYEGNAVLFRGSFCFQVRFANMA